jgi:hypothetical protein
MYPQFRKRNCRNHAKTFFLEKKVLESKKGAGTTTKLTLLGTVADGKAA